LDDTRVQVQREVNTITKTSDRFTSEELFYINSEPIEHGDSYVENWSNMEKEKNVLGNVNNVDEVYKASDEGKKKLHILIDSGAFMNMTNDLTLFETLSSRNTNLVVAMANNTKTAVLGTGDIHFSVLDNLGTKQDIKLKDVLYIPALDKTILSTGSFHKDQAHEFRLKHLTLMFNNEHESFSKLIEVNNLPYLVTEAKCFQQKIFENFNTNRLSNVTTVSIDGK
jgi:hypothetical protein